MSVAYEKDGSIAVFTFDNGKVNVFTPEMHRELFAALSDFVSDPAIRVGIMAGSAGKSFSAGDDIKMPLPARTPHEALEAHLFPHVHDAKGLSRPGFEQDVMRLKRHKPIIGAVDGYCLGQGLIYLLLLTDIRLATPRAEFGFPEIAFGMGGAGGMVRIGRQIPHTVAMEMLLLGERIDAEKAERVHLVNRIVPVDTLMREARGLAERIASHPPVAIRVEMEAYARAMDMPAEQAIDYVGTLFRLQRIAYNGYGAGTGFFGTAGATDRP